MNWREQLAKFVSGEQAVIKYEAIPELQQAHVGLTRRAHQLRRHAEQAPNQLNRLELTRLADEDEAQARQLGEALLGMGSQPIDAPLPPSITGALNHWARLVEDLEAHRSTVRQLRERVIHFAETLPETAAIFDRLYDAEEKHLVVLRDLIARTDPQALN